MAYRYAVIGSGRQGTAAGYDLALLGNASHIIMMDQDEKTAIQSASRINKLCRKDIATWKCVDAKNYDVLRKILIDIDGLISAIPYFYNFDLSKICIETKTNMTDMGGNEDIVLSQLSLDQSAKESGVLIIPDCGMGPGLTVSLAAYGISFIDEPHEVFIWDGGLPQKPEPPWNYNLSFHINGLTNEYDGYATFLRDGKIVKIPSLSELEEVEFSPLGKLEAFVTSGGATTAILSYEGKIKTFQNKTLRYPGHCQHFLSYKLLGLFDEKEKNVDGSKFIPREIFHTLLTPLIKAPINYNDICIIRVLVRGKKEQHPYECTLEIIERYDQKTYFTAMEKLTGYHSSIMLFLSLKNNHLSGVIGPERAIDPPDIIEELKKRNIHVDIKQ